MRTKDLFIMVEAANFVASRIDAKRVFVHCDTLERLKGNFVLELSVTNVTGNGSRFYTWEAFAAAIAADYTEDVLELVDKGEISDHGDGVFMTGRAGFALRFTLCRE